VSGEDQPTGSTAGPAAFTLTGTLTVSGTSYSSTDPRGCTTSGGYTDISNGAAVTVYDAAGTVVAKGTLGLGTDGLPLSRQECVFPVSVPNVPAGPRFYQVEISHRGKLTVSADDAVAGRFTASLR
jgi:hypothetical protein